MRSRRRIQRVRVRQVADWDWKRNPVDQGRKDRGPRGRRGEDRRKGKLCRNGPAYGELHVVASGLSPFAAFAPSSEGGKSVGVRRFR